MKSRERETLIQGEHEREERKMESVRQNRDEGFMSLLVFIMSVKSIKAHKNL